MDKLSLHRGPKQRQYYSRTQQYQPDQEHKRTPRTFDDRYYYDIMLLVPFLRLVEKDAPDHHHRKVRPKPILLRKPTDPGSIDSSDDDDSSFYTKASSNSSLSLPQQASPRKQKKTYAERLERWKNVKRIQRRDVNLRYVEQKILEERENEEKRRVQTRIAEEEAREEAALQRARRESAEAFKEYVARVDAERHQEAELLRKKRWVDTAQRMALFAKADLERYRKTTPPQDHREDKPAELRPSPEKDDEIALTQEVLRMERQSGMIPAVVAKKHRPKKEEDDQNVLYLRKDVEHPRITPGVHTMKGDGIGRKGAKRLATQLSKNGRGDVAAIDLSFSAIQNDGLAALLASVSPSKLTKLRLAANHLTHSAVDLIINAKLVSLEILDLKHNVLKDRGACKLASAVLASKFTTLTHLVLCHNDIRHRGIKALFEAFSAEALTTKLCPRIHEVNVRFNKAAIHNRRSAFFIC